MPKTGVTITALIFVLMIFFPCSLSDAAMDTQQRPTEAFVDNLLLEREIVKQEYDRDSRSGEDQHQTPPVIIKREDFWAAEATSVKSQSATSDSEITKRRAGMAQDKKQRRGLLPAILALFVVVVLGLRLYQLSKINK